MLRTLITVSAGILASAVCLGGTALAQTATTATTSTTTSTSTTTTLQPHPYSPATRECVRAARQAFKDCPNEPADCLKAYQTAFALCFKGTDGQKCATKCTTNQSKCVTNVPTTKKTCRKTCRTNRNNDIKACRLIPDGDDIWSGGDSGCITTAQLTYKTCRFQCAHARGVCHTNFKFCIADCPNL